MPSPPGVPPFDKIYVIITWVSTGLWGMNTVIFAGVCYVLFMRPNSRMTRVILGGTSILLYLMITTHVALSLREELDAFVDVPPGSPPFYATLYYSQITAKYAIAKNLIYAIAVFIQDLVLIWRMYVVWTHNWKIIIIPLVVELAHTACSLTAICFGFVPGYTIQTPIVQVLATTVGWTIEIAVNVLVTGAIVGRLWYMGRRISFAESKGSIAITRPGIYLRTIFTIVESGALLVAVTISMLVLSHVGSPVGLPFMDVAIQVAALVPYLIVVRVGLGLTHALPNAYETYLQTISNEEGMTFRVNTFGTQSSGIDKAKIVPGGSPLSNSMTSQGNASLGDFRAADGPDTNV
ncbi:hypothetical protein BD311DRAFT_770772 [Dichomitus squalens]|uniref:Uncharacterized protein n=1 Tax=Dichomitus squalens TaxID=114155 RepID=A0A4Q9M968_9APHY|nr:hypothetical protein BD311DRAFT_770772 [Dichomitus squalens]